MRNEKGTKGISSIIGRIITGACLLLAAVTVSCTYQIRIDNYQEPSIMDLSPEERNLKCADDYQSILRYHDNIEKIHIFIKSRKDIFGRPEELQKKVFNADEREAVLQTWRSLLDNYLALESIRRFHSDYHLIEDTKQKYPSFRCYYASYVSQYRYALELLAVTDKDKTLAFVLNEDLPEVGLDKNSYAQFKSRYLNIFTATEFAAIDLWYRDYKRRKFERVSPPIEKDSSAIWKFGRGKGIIMTLKNSLVILKDSAKRLFFPVQSGVAEWMGDTRLVSQKKSKITQAQLEELLARMQPGDIMLERRDWYLSNIGLPGYWPHAALFIGTAGERRAFFDDEALIQWVKEQGEESGDFEKLLEKRHPGAYGTATAMPGEGHPFRVIEAMSEGVCFTTFEHSGHCDSLAVLRPRLSKIERARAILVAFSYQGRPYDFDFDFRTDKAIVCTELVYKSYEPTTGFTGIQFMLKTMMGRRVMPANEIAHQFDQFYKGPLHQTDFVAFLDGYQRSGEAVEASLAQFRHSWKRPKWTLFKEKQYKEEEPVAFFGDYFIDTAFVSGAQR